MPEAHAGAEESPGSAELSVSANEPAMRPAIQGVPLEEALFGGAAAPRGQPELSAQRMGIIRRVPSSPGGEPSGPSGAGRPPSSGLPPRGPGGESGLVEPGGPALQVDVVRRSIQIGEMTSSVETTPSGGAQAGGEGQGVNIEQLAEQVYRLLRQRLRIEREREGEGGGSWR